MKLILQAIRNMIGGMERRLREYSSLITKALNTANETAASLKSTQERADEAYYMADSAEFIAKEAADSVKATVNGKLDVVDPVGRGSFSLNRKASSTVGAYSVATGYDCVASGNYCFANGLDCEATGNYAHAEGRLTKAAGLYSHAENMGCEALVSACHAEGWYTVASGLNAHAEGEYTTAAKADTHAEGYHTIANSDFQHVQGKWNIEDSNDKYAHIVGNGSDKNHLSNAHTLDWKGNAWFAGYVEGTALILLSSGGKRFKVTVDDSGTLSTAEVTA